MIRHQVPEQPHHLDIAPSVPLQPVAGRDPVEVAIDEQLQQNGGMVAGPPGPRMRRALKAKARQIN